MKNKNPTIKVNLKDDKEWIEKLKVQPTVRIDLDSLTDELKESKKK